MVEAGYLFLNALWTGPQRRAFVQRCDFDRQEHSGSLYGPCCRLRALNLFIGYGLCLHALVHSKFSARVSPVSALRYFASRWTALGRPAGHGEGRAAKTQQQSMRLLSWGMEAHYCQRGKKRWKSSHDENNLLSRSTSKFRHVIHNLDLIY